MPSIPTKKLKNFKEAHPNEADHIEPIAFGIGFYDL